MNLYPFSKHQICYIRFQYGSDIHYTEYDKSFKIALRLKLMRRVQGKMSICIARIRPSQSFLLVRINLFALRFDPKSKVSIRS